MLEKQTWVVGQAVRFGIAKTMQEKKWRQPFTMLLKQLIKELEK